MPMYRAQVRAANLRINISFSASRFLPILQPRAFMFKHGMVRGETAFPCWSTQRTLDLLLICRETGQVPPSTHMDDYRVNQDLTNTSTRPASVGYIHSYFNC